MTYAEKLKDPRWQKRRLHIFNRDKFICVKCGDAKTELQVHHRKYFKEPWDAPDMALETVCNECHGVITHLECKDSIRILKQSNGTGNMFFVVRHLDGFNTLISKDIKGEYKYLFKVMKNDDSFNLMVNFVNADV